MQLRFYIFSIIPLSQLVSVLSPTLKYLKVSFFGPFYGSYIVIELDHDNYEYSMVCGPNRSYLWILGRRPHLDQRTIDALIRKASQLGFETDKLIFVSHK